MDMRLFDLVLATLALVAALALWAFAFSLAARTGRLLLSAGLYLIFEPRQGRHIARAQRDERPTYDGDPVDIRDERTEAERAAEYAAMRARTEMLPITVSAAPLVDFAAQLHPTDLEQLKAELEAIERDVLRTFRMRVDAALMAFTGDYTQEFAAVS
jgi:hypothetical protein